MNQKNYNCKKVYIFAQGFSEMIAREMQIKLELLDKNVEFHDDPNVIIPISNYIKRSNLIIFSLNGET